MRPLLLASMLAALLAHAEDMPPEKRAALAHDQQKASDAVDKKYGNKAFNSKRGHIWGQYKEYALKRQQSA